jgi:hypothetical protein
MSGIPLWIGQYGGSLVNPRTDVRITHIARPVPEDEAREAVIAAAREWRTGLRRGRSSAGDLVRALKRLDQARAERGATA